jgi:hypothetical protein
LEGKTQQLARLTSGLNAAFSAAIHDGIASAFERVVEALDSGQTVRAALSHQIAAAKAMREQAQTDLGQISVKKNENEGEHNA